MLLPGSLRRRVRVGVDGRRGVVGRDSSVRVGRVRRCGVLGHDVGLAVVVVGGVRRGRSGRGGGGQVEVERGRGSGRSRGCGGGRDPLQDDVRVKLRVGAV